MTKTRYRLVRAAVIGAATVAAATGVAAPAEAATVRGCAQSWDPNGYHGTCVTVETGEKKNGTQWVSKVSVGAPRGASAGLLEGWAGDGPTGIAWYRSSNGTSAEWTVNKWIKSGSGICGAFTYSGSTNRSIACITITA